LTTFSLTITKILVHNLFQIYFFNLEETMFNRSSTDLDDVYEDNDSSIPLAPRAASSTSVNGSDYRNKAHTARGRVRTNARSAFDYIQLATQIGIMCGIFGILGLQLQMSHVLSSTGSSQYVRLCCVEE
jgi:TRAP-type uncharacterized transport system fused permease subunit